MATKLIELKDGTLVEIDLPGEQIEKISGGLADKVDATFNQVKPTLVNICRSFSHASLQDKKRYDYKRSSDRAWFNFEAEGNIYITKVSSGAKSHHKNDTKAKIRFLPYWGKLCLEF